MAIGIAAAGPFAGQAVFLALKKAEEIPLGVFVPSHIWGFTVFSVMLEDGRIVTCKAQRGGTTTLITDAEETGVEPPPEVASARLAAVISAGPDRPEPLEQFLPVKEKVGMVTGHRIPNTPSVKGRPINLEILELMEKGANAAEAVHVVMEENPEADAGIVAIDANGIIGSENSRRVGGRNDLGTAIREDSAAGARVHVLQNAIHPPQPIADVAADVAMAVMTKDLRVPSTQIIVKAGLRVELGEEDAVHVDDNLEAVKILTADPTVLKGRVVCDVPYLGARVFREGREIGRITDETLVVLEDGVMTELSGAQIVNLGVRS